MQKITYLMSVFSAEEMKKPKTKRVALGQNLVLDASEPYDTLKAQMLVRIVSALNPTKIALDDYTFNYTIARLVTVPLSLSSESDYGFLISQATKAKTASNVKITVVQTVSQVRKLLDDLLTP